MDFGKVESSELAAIDFSLPPDTELTKATLGNSNIKDGFTAHVGLSSWGNEGWKGKIYPPKISSKEYLNEYVRHFNTIELNATFYNIPKAEQVIRWKEQTAGRADFRFCLRVPQGITHIRALKNAEKLTAEFYDSIRNFGDKLGPLMLQLGKNFSIKSFDNLAAYLPALPKDIPVFVEARHKAWFEADGKKKLFDTLHDLNTGSIISDVAGRRDSAHMELTTPHAMIRFGAYDQLADYERLNAWVDRIKVWKEMGLQSLWFYIHEGDDNNGPLLANHFIKRLNQDLGTDMEPPVLLG